MAEVERAVVASEWSTQADIGSRSISEYLTLMAAEGKSDKTRANVRGYLSSFLAWSVETERREDNPTRAVTVRRRGGRRSGGKRSERAFTWAEVKRLIEAAQRSEAMHQQARRYPRSLIYRVAATTGLRRGEIERLRWSMLELDADRPHAILPPEVCKNRCESVVPIPSETACALRAHRDASDRVDDEMVFPAMPWHGTLWRDMKAAGVDRTDRHGRRASFKSFRSAFNTELARRGVNLDLRMVLMRHSDPRLTANTYLDRENLEAMLAVDKLPRLNGLPRISGGRMAGSAHESGPPRLDIAGRAGQLIGGGTRVVVTQRHPEIRRSGEPPRGDECLQTLEARGDSPVRPNGSRRDDLYKMTPGGFEPPFPG